MTDRWIKFMDENEKQLQEPFRTGWGCPLGCKVCFQGRGTWVVTKRTEIGMDRLEVVVKKMEVSK